MVDDRPCLDQLTIDAIQTEVLKQSLNLAGPKTNELTSLFIAAGEVAHTYALMGANRNLVKALIKLAAITASWAQEIDIEIEPTLE